MLAIICSLKILNDLCYGCASDLFKKRLMLRYAQSRNTDHFDLTRPEIRRIEARFIYINCFDLHVFLFSLILIY